jgi:arylsulfatase A-like enzyme
MRKINLNVIVFFALIATFQISNAQNEIIHDAEFYIIEDQNKERWNDEDSDLNKRLAELKKEHGTPPNIVYILFDDQQFGAIGFPGIQKILGYSTPIMNTMAQEGINFTRMYTEPACTPTRAAFLTGRNAVRSGMGVVGMPHEFAGLAEEEVTIAEILSKAGYATAHYGKGHVGDIEESYLHNQGFDEALFTPMNQITSLYNPQAAAANAVLGLHPELGPKDPYQLDDPGLLPKGWVLAIDGKKGELGKEWCGTSNECYEKMDIESEKRTLDFIRTNAQAKKPFYVQYWPNWLNFLLPQAPKTTINGGKVPQGYTKMDAFVGQVMQTLKDEGIEENTLFIIMADNGPMVHNQPPGWAMTELFFTGGKGDFTEGGIRVPALAWWPGTIKEGQIVGDMLHVTDLYSTFANIAGATKYIPTDRIIDGIDQTSLFLNGDTHGRRDFVFVYQGHDLAAIIKGRYKRHIISPDPNSVPGVSADFYDLYQDPKEQFPHFVPLVHTQGQFTRMQFRHELMKKTYPDKANAKAIPLTGLSNARPETKAIKDMVERQMKLLPIELEDYLEIDNPKLKLNGDWGH